MTTDCTQTESANELQDEDELLAGDKVKVYMPEYLGGNYLIGEVKALGNIDGPLVVVIEGNQHERR